MTDQNPPALLNPSFVLIACRITSFGLAFSISFCKGGELNRPIHLSLLKQG